MLFTPIYIAMTFIKTWRIRSFRARLLEFLNGNTSVAFCKVPENAAETPTLSSKLCTNPKNAYLCDLLDYTNTTRICSMKPTQCIEISDWVSCSGGLPLGSSEQSPVTDLDVDVLFECEMEPHEGSSQQDIITLESMGQPMAWKAGSHLAIVVKTNIEKLSVIGFNFVGGEFVIDHKLPVVRVQTVQLSGEANKATDPAMRSLRSEVQHGLKVPPEEFQWPIHAALLRKLSKVVDIKSDVKHTVEMNGSTEITLDTPRKHITLADVSCNTGKSLGEEEPVKLETKLTESVHKTPEKSPEKKVQPEQPEEVVLENVTVEIQHNITPKKSSLKLDLKKGTSSLSTSLLNISSQIKSVTTHKRIVSTTKKQPPQIESSVIKEESQKESPQQSTPKSAKCSRPLVNTKSPNVLIYSDSVAARDNLEASLRKVLDCDRYILYSVSKETLEAGAWRGRAALVAVAGCVGRGAPLLLAHLLDGGRLLALCSDLLHTVLPYYKTAEVRENEVVQFSFDKWKSVKMKHHIFCYQASPAKKQFSTESDRQPSKYTGHPGHELDIQVLASEETWRTPSLLQATDLTNNGIAIFSQIHLADPSDYLGEEGIKSNEARLEIIHKILGDILGLHVREPSQLPRVEYTRGFFLGNHVHKLSLVEKWCGGASPRLQKLGAMTLQWCLRDEAPLEPPAPGFLPVHVYECPEHFSTVEYYTVSVCRAPLRRHARLQGAMTLQWCLRDEAPLEPPAPGFLPVHVYECPEHFSTVEYYTVSVCRAPLRRHARLQGAMTLQWCLRDEAPLEPPAPGFLPVHVYECPEHFSTVEYYTVSVCRAPLRRHARLQGAMTLQWCLRDEAPLEPPAPGFLPVHVYECPEHFSTVEYYTVSVCRAPLRRHARLQGAMTLQWCLRDEAPLEPPAPGFLPVHVYECPEHFSTVEYYTHLTSSQLGRVVVYADVLSSTLNVTGTPLAHGVACVARRQTAGRGRTGNAWLTPEGQAAISVQTRNNVNSVSSPGRVVAGRGRTGNAWLTPEGQAAISVQVGLRHGHGVACVARRQTAGRGRTGNAWLTPEGQAAISVQVWQKVTPSLPLVQHASALAVVRALRSQPAYEHLEIRIKWPNDIYYGREVKIGGTATEANCTYNDVVINIGTGVNITNSQPTMCVNDIIAEHNKRHGTSLAPISVERFLARYCSELERTLEYMASDGGVQAFLEQYYQYWLHTYCSELERTLEYMASDGGVQAFLEQYYQYWLHTSCSELERTLEYMASDGGVQAFLEQHYQYWLHTWSGLLEYMASDGGVQAFLEQYYQYWLHTGEEIRVLLKDSGTPVAGCVAGVDEAGWLLVATPTGELRVAPDGNTFDMMAGLVAPKM
ncbi:uncharacterized protein LOC135081876 [Ostrinia nubilalis]|uniref:uncharacterized protein LOC135081876 n=1 Tax=Ostrinia nubilalis TaxID=29057 RepID=UPI0030823DAE